MSPLLLAGAAGAVAALAALNWVLYGWPRAGLPDLATAEARLAADLIGFSPGEGVLCEDGRAALVLDEASGRAGLVVIHGADLVTRLAGAPDLRRVAANEEGDLTLDLADFTLPRVTIRCADARSANAWAERLRALR